MIDVQYRKLYKKKIDKNRIFYAENGLSTKTILKNIFQFSIGARSKNGLNIRHL